MDSFCLNIITHWHTTETSCMSRKWANFILPKKSFSVWSVFVLIGTCNFKIHFRRHYYRPQRSCRQGYVFTRVCHSVNRGGCLLLGGVCSGGCLLSGGVCSQGVSTFGGCLLRGCLLWGVSVPRGVSALGGVCSQGGVCLGGVCSRGCLPLGVVSACLFWRGGSRARHMVNERPVRILLECILVTISACIFVKIDYHWLDLFMPTQIPKDSALESTHGSKSSKQSRIY